MITMPVMSDFPRWLEKKFLEWQNQQGARKNIAEFAAYLGVSQAIVSYWMNGTRNPSRESVELLTDTFGFEVYDVLGLPRPNENLFYIQSHWDQLSPESQRALREMAERYAAKTRPKKD